MNTIKTTNVQYINTLRALATLGVILIHVSSPVLKMTYLNNMPYWWVGNIVSSLVRFPVPLFLMLSGATLLVKEYNLGEFYKKRMMRVLVPFLFWLLVYWVFRWVMLLPKQQPHGFADISRWAIDLFMNEGVSKHLWYIYMILFIYLFVPFIGKIVRKASQLQLFTFLLVWAVLCFATRSMSLSFYKWNGDYLLKLLGYFEYSGYLVLGYYLNNIRIKSTKTHLYATLAYLATVVVCALAVYLMSKNDNRLNLSIYSNYSLTTILQSAAIFMLIKNIEIKNTYFNVVQNTISNYSYGIYLAHIIVISVLFRNGIYWSFAHPLISLPLMVLMVLAGSLLIVFVLRKIPGGKYVAG